MNCTKTLWILDSALTQQQNYKEILAPYYQCSFFSNLRDFQAQYLIPTAPFPDFIITDLQLSDGDFFDFFENSEQLTLDRMNRRFMVVSNTDDLGKMRRAIEHGAIDYVVRPFHTNELLVKLERILRPQSSLANILPEELLSELTPKEEKILKYFLEAKNQTLHRDDICRMIWKKVFVNNKTFDVHIYNLRRKLTERGLAIRSEGQGQFRLIGPKM